MGEDDDDSCSGSGGARCDRAHPDDAYRVTPDMIFDCPFCALCTVIVADLEDGRTLVVHSLPMCEVFLAEEPVAFLERVRKKLHETNLNLS